jgi:DNA-binding beta-propeller fold protein YncE
MNTHCGAPAIHTLRLSGILAIGAVSVVVAAVPLQAQTPPSTSWLAGWPMSGHDPQRTYRSPLIGPTSPRLLFKRSHVFVNVTGPNGHMYGTRQKGKTFAAVALSPKGRPVRTYPFDVPPVVVRPDGAVISMGSDDQTAIAYTPIGKKLWKRTNIGLPKSAHSLVTENNTFYAPFEGHPEDRTAGLDLFSATGRRTRIDPGTSVFGVTVAPDGRTYIRTFDNGSNQSTLQALTSSGTVRWKQPLGTGVDSFPSCTCLMADSNAIYASQGNTIIAYSPSGTFLWRFTKPDQPLALAERADSVLLIAGFKTLDAVDQQGKLLWTATIAIAKNAEDSPSLIVDAAGTAYIGRQDGAVQIVNRQGRTVTTLPAGGYHYGFTPSLLLVPPGRLVVNGTDSVLRIFGR